MAKNIKNMAASVHERLLKLARETSRPFNELLQLFAIERFIYRLSKSPHADRFILKGALMLSVWSGPVSRPTMDIDLLGKTGRRLVPMAGGSLIPGNMDKIRAKAEKMRSGLVA